MNFVDLKRENLTVTYNDVTYTKEMYKTATSITGVVDEDHNNWDVATNYTVGQYCIVPELKSIYKSASAHAGKFPPAYLNSDWTFWGFVNSYNMFAADENIGSKTVGVTSMTFDFNQMNTIALIDIDFIGNLNISQVDSSSSQEVLNFNISSRDISCSTFAQYCFKAIKSKLFKKIVDNIFGVW